MIYSSIINTRRKSERASALFGVIVNGVEPHARNVIWPVSPGTHSIPEPMLMSDLQSINVAGW